MKEHSDNLHHQISITFDKIDGTNLTVDAISRAELRELRRSIYLNYCLDKLNAPEADALTVFYDEALEKVNALYPL